MINLIEELTAPKAVTATALKSAVRVSSSVLRCSIAAAIVKKSLKLQGLTLDSSIVIDETTLSRFASETGNQTTGADALAAKYLLSLHANNRLSGKENKHAPRVRTFLNEVVKYLNKRGIEDLTATEVKRELATDEYLAIQFACHTQICEEEVMLQYILMQLERQSDAALRARLQAQREAAVTAAATAEAEAAATAEVEEEEVEEAEEEE